MSHEELTTGHVPDHAPAYRALEVLRSIVLDYVDSDGEIRLSNLRLVQAINAVGKARPLP